MIPALPANELARLAMLQRYALLDTSPDPMFDDIVSMAARVLSVPVATVTLVDADRQRFKACVGVPNQSVAREHSFCAHTILTDQLLVVPDLTADPRFRDNPLVAGAPFVRFYAGVPLAGEDGSLVGVLCIMDLRPRELGDWERRTLEDLAAMAMTALRLRLAMLVNEQLAVAVAGVGAGVLVTDPRQPDNPIVFSNPAFERITGYAAHEALGRNCRFLQGPETDRSLVDEIRRSIAASETFHGTLLNYRKDGVPFLNDLTITPMRDADGALLNFVAIQNDVTARERAEALVRESYEALRVLEGQRDSLTSMIVHDMRSPLSVAMGSLELVRSGDATRLDAEDQEALKFAADAIQELNLMITSLLDVSRLEDGQFPLDLSDHDLAALVYAALESRRIVEGDGRLTVEGPPAPVVARCDAGLATRVLVNLVGNALKFTPASGRVSVRISRTDGVCRVEVADTGPGIAAEHHAMVFEKFGQVKATRTAHSTGLGFAFCRLAVEAQGGAIGLVSKVGHGSTFWFTLP